MSMIELRSNCSNRSFHNLCKKSNIPFSAARILGLGLKFCVCDRPPPSDLSHFDIERMRKEIRTAWTLFLKSDPTELCPNNDWNPKIYVKNPNWVPNKATPPIEQAMDNFESVLKTIVQRDRWKKFTSNLTRHELRQIQALRKNKEITILPSDKNLGPVALDTDTYTQQILTEHLLDNTRYEILTREDATNQLKEASQATWELFKEYYVYFTEAEQQYVDRSYKTRADCRPAHFYGIPKLHKKGYPLRPIVSKVNSELEILSKFVDYQLQQVVPLCKFYIRDSWHLMDKLRMLEKLPENARLTVFDAVAMYCNIDTDHAIESLRKWFQSHEHELPRRFPTAFVLKAINIVMKWNIFNFDDIVCRQKNGTAMGTSLACMYATLYFTYHEEQVLCNPEHEHGILFYVRFIDDVFLIQKQYPGSHARLEHAFNNFGQPGKRLKWTTDGPKTSVTFLDLNLKLVDGRVTWSTFVKPMNLHLYIPSFSAHAPSMKKGLIFGMIRRFWLQNPNEQDFIKFARLFYRHLKARGYNEQELQDLFLEASTKLDNPSLGKEQSNSADRERIFLHLRYHPFQISRQEIQSIFHQELSETLQKESHPAEAFDRFGIKRLVIAVSRAPNLRSTDPYTTGSFGTYARV